MIDTTLLKCWIIGGTNGSENPRSTRIQGKRAHCVGPEWLAARLRPHRDSVPDNDRTVCHMQPDAGLRSGSTCAMLARPPNRKAAVAYNGGLRLRLQSALRAIPCWRSHT
jgi:hypothetical protein